MLDRAGQLMAGACAIHCLIVPLTIGVLPVVGLELIADRRVERLLVALAIGIGTAALVPSFLRTHRRALPIAAFGCGAALLVAAQTLAADGTALGRVLTLAGAVTIAAAHTVNIRCCLRAQQPAG
jgi:hypothetical protein